jgi:predicted nuclease of predicted toxin-antitoxin system
MKFIVDECTGPAVVQWLRSQGHEVISVFEDCRGIDDEEIIKKAASEESILVTNDKDFGEKVFREGRLHHGVILMRLSDERPAGKIQILKRLITHHGSILPDNFVVVTEEGIRIAKRD